MTDFRFQLAEVFRQIVERTDLDTNAALSERLVTVMQLMLDEDHADKFNDPSKESLKTAGGKALSAEHAIDCLREPDRTVLFIQGVHQAIQSLQKTSQKRKGISTVYAGTGPFAPLIIPALCAHPEWEIDILLLEFNPQSFEVLNKVLSKLGLNEQNIRVVRCDASTIDLEDEKFDLIISETMFRALLDEPQAFITANLCKYLEPKGKLIPEAIHLSLFQGRYADQVLFPAEQESGGANWLKELRFEYPPFFQLDRNFVSSEGSGSEPAFTSKWIDLGTYEPDKPDVCIATEVEVFSDLLLSYGQSTITNPYCLFSRANWPDKNHVQLRYYRTQAPHWKYTLK